MPIVNKVEGGSNVTAGDAVLPNSGNGRDSASVPQPTSSLEDIRRNWESFGKTDPLWAICSDESRRNGRWDRNEFFLTGRCEIETVLKYLRMRGVNLPVGKSAALDFGCGVGRLSQALAQHFERVQGVDIAASMIEQANQWNLCGERCSYHHNKESNLRLFPDGTFDFIYSSIVLQHIPEVYVEGYLVEFIRVLKPGGFAVFQLPTINREAPKQVPDSAERGFLARARRKLALRQRAQSLLQSLNLNGNEVKKVECQMEMHGIPESDIRELIACAGGKVLDAATTNSTDPAFNGNLQYLDEDPKIGWTSKQYCVTK